MKKGLLLAMAAVLVWAAAALAQLQITSLKPDGELAWTNWTGKGFYSVESADSPTGPWIEITNLVDLDPARTNPITVRVLLTNAHASYRVVWVPPVADGDWDCYAYDLDGTLAVTGKLSLVTKSLVATNPVTQYRVAGTRNFGYVGSVSNAPWYLGPLIRTDPPFNTGPVGALKVDYAELTLWWPTNCFDCQVGLLGTLLPNTYTGHWSYYTWVGPYVGRFEAVRMPSTNSIKYDPQSPEQVSKKEK